MSKEKALVQYEEVANTVKYDQHACHDPRTTTRTIETQKDSAMAETLLLEPPRFWSRTTLKLFACLFVTCLCSAQNGFDSNTFGGVSAMPNFKAQFGTNIAATNGFLAALYVIGESHSMFVEEYMLIFVQEMSLVVSLLVHVRTIGDEKLECLLPLPSL